MSLLIPVVSIKNIEEETNSSLFKTKLLVRVTFFQMRKSSFNSQGNYLLGY